MVAEFWIWIYLLHCSVRQDCVRTSFGAELPVTVAHDWSERAGFHGWPSFSDAIIWYEPGVFISSCFQLGIILFHHSRLIDLIYDCKIVCVVAKHSSIQLLEYFQIWLAVTEKVILSSASWTVRDLLWLKRTALDRFERVFMASRHIGGRRPYPCIWSIEPKSRVGRSFFESFSRS